jgi:hypothetical protein
LDESRKCHGPARISSVAVKKSFAPEKHGHIGIDKYNRRFKRIDLVSCLKGQVPDKPSTGSIEIPNVARRGQCSRAMPNSSASDDGIMI